MRLTRRTLLTGAVGLGVAGAAGAAVVRDRDEKPTGPMVTRVVYGDDPSQIGDLHLPPPGTDKLPVAVVIHGVFWRSEYGIELATPLAEDLTKHGWAAYALEYRRVGNGGGWPNTLQDVADGIDALGDHADRLDLSKVVTIGHSAGGQLAMWAAARFWLPADAPGSAPRVMAAAAVSQAGVLDMIGASSDRIGEPVAQLLGGTPRKVMARYRLASPYERLPLRVPAMLLHGTADDVVPIAQSSRYASTAHRAGDRVELIRLPGVSHFELIDPRNESWKICRDRLPSLLRS